MCSIVFIVLPSLKSVLFVCLDQANNQYEEDTVGAGDSEVEMFVSNY